MPDKFDPYREALIIEEKTIWPEELADVPPESRATIAKRLHADAASCEQLEYVRLHTGFCRQITVTQADVARIEARS
ncbi:hypothetical protein ACYFX5_02655 [Bremerella sp. T1]|uniref:hypothetical protein n=1 Tax=Bremerella sp. TYQ1 TaxID=3119568 RepID=UPI001CC938E8|nr:hypothetical protein [Bremerella volcania]UBM37171.1 hypothetical protein LA756_04610 [Bremerella volcania]